MKIRESLLISLSSNYLRLGIHFIVSVIIARLLTPEEFGIFSISMVLIFIADTLRNFGITSYIVQEKNLNQARLNAASGLNYLTSWTLATIIYLSSDIAARYYGAHGIGEVLRLLSINFLLLPISATTMAYMRRELLFGQIAIIQVSSNLVSAVVAVALAYSGLSYMSLAWATILATITDIFLINLFKPTGLRIRPSFREISHIFHFGSLATITSLVQEASKYLPNLLLGKLISIEAVAFLGRASGLLELFMRLIMNALYNVAMPHFSAQIRDAKDPLPTYQLATSHITVIGWPFYIVLAVTAPILIPFLFGNQWHASIVLVQLLCMGELLLTPFYLMNQLLIAKGRMRFVTLFTVVSALVRIPPIILLSPYGLDVAIAGYAGTSVLIAIASYFISVRQLDCAPGAFFGALKASTVTTLVLVLCVATASLAARPYMLPETVELGLLLVVAMIGWLFGLRLSHHPLWGEATSLLARFRRK